jgi:hypothetical protein
VEDMQSLLCFSMVPGSFYGRSVLVLHFISPASTFFVDLQFFSLVILVYLFLYRKP